MSIDDRPDYKYHISLDINRDAWNWYDATKGNFQSFDWRSNLRDDKDIEIFDKIKILNKKDAEIIIKKYLKLKYKNEILGINKYKKAIKIELDKNFYEACDWLQKVTKKSLAVKDYKFIITTFPRCPYDYRTGLIFINYFKNFVSINPISLFLHEALHFQFHHFWQQDKDSPISKLSDYDFNFLKESLTVILDDDLKPLMSKADKGYPAHQSFRKELHKEWLKNHDFDKLVDFGLKKLPEFLLKG